MKSLVSRIRLNLLNVELLMALLGAVALPSPSRAEDVAEKAAKAAAKAATEAYLKEQAKYRLGEYLNKNHHLLGSADKLIGTKAMNVLSQAMGVYGLINAKTDKERGYAAAHLIMSPEPASAVILIAVQLIDTVISLQAQEQILRIQREIAELQKQSVAVRMKLAELDKNEVSSAISALEDTARTIKENLAAIEKHPVYLFINQGAAPSEEIGGAQGPTSEDIQSALNIIYQTSFYLDRLGVATIRADAVFRNHEVFEVQQLADLARMQNEGFNETREAIGTLKSAVRSFFAIYKTEKALNKINSKFEDKEIEAEAFLKCSEMYNSYHSQKGLAPNEPSRKAAKQFINECRIKFGIF